MTHLGSRTYRHNLVGIKHILLDFLRDTLHVEALDITYPQEGASGTVEDKRTSHILFLPVEDASFDTDGVNSAWAQGTFKVVLRYKYPSTLSYSELDVPRLEQLYEAVNVYALMKLRKYKHITNLAPVVVDYPVSVRREESEHNDWVADVLLTYAITYSITDVDIHPDFSVEQPEDVPLHSIRIKTYRSALPLDIPTARLDLDYYLLRNEP